MAACGTVREKQVFCDVCGVSLPSAILLPTHNKGKKHQRLLNLKKERDSSSRKSVYVRGFQNSGSIEEELTKYFNVYGKVSNIFLDKDKGVFAIVEFADEESVTAVLTLESLPLFNGKRLTVKERTIKKAALQVKGQKSRKRKRHDSQPDREGQLDNKEMASFLSEDLITKLKSSLTVEEQLNLLMQHLCLTDEDIKLRGLVCQLLQEVFAEVYPGSSVVPFGSTVSGVGWTGSDLDVCLLTSVAPSQCDETGVDYSLVIDMLRSFAPGCTNIIPVLTAKCPLVKFTHQPSGLSCDLSVNNRLGVANSDLLRCYMSLDPRISQLVFIVRAWAKAKALAAGRHLTSYALTLMVLYFLQTQDPPVIPSLQQGFESWIKPQSHSSNKELCGYHESLVEELESTMIDNWNCSFFTDVARLSSSNNNKSPSRLLEEFFYFFSTEFDFANCVVSIRHGHSTSITSVLEELKGADYLKTAEDRSCVTSKDDPTCEKQSTKVNHCESTSEIILSTEKITEQQKVVPSSSMASSQCGLGSSKRTELKISPMCVQDPFELVHNLTQNITVSALKHIIELMKTAHRICTDLNDSGDNPSNKTNKLLDLLTVCRSSKKRKSSHCHSFFVEYQDVSLQALTGSHNAKLTTPREIFLFITDSLEREFGFKCEKKLRDSEKESDLSQASQPVKMSRASHPLQGTPAEHCADNGKDSDANKGRDQARKTDQNDKTEDNLSAICTAFENTWTHCRRERRRLLQSQRNEKGETAVEDSLLNEKSEQTYPEKSGECTLQISSSCRQPEKFPNVSMVASPILIFQLTVNSSPGKNVKAGCTVSMEDAESSHFQLFGNFFSAYKNYFMGLMIK